MDHAAQEGAGRQHHGPGPELAPISARDAAGAAIGIEQEVVHRALDHLKPGCRFQQLDNGVAVEGTVRLRPRAVHRRSLRAVQQLEVDTRTVGGDAHQPVEGVDLAD